MSLFDRILAARGLIGKKKAAFLSSDYSLYYDPFLLPDTAKAVNRLYVAHKKQQHIVIYGDYDIDGLTASALLIDAFNSFGYKKVDSFIPNRFVEGYGMTVDAIENLASMGAQLIVTVDCGSLSEQEISRAKELGVDVIVTDHHVVGPNIPKAIAVINPKRVDSKYPFKDLAGVGVAFKLVQAMQTKLKGISTGREKWLLDLVALGTVCDVVPLVDENRMLVYFGLKVFERTKRPGLKALMAIAGIDPKNINTRSLSYGIGPRMNAAGRLETAKYALDMLITGDYMLALEKAEYLDYLNKTRQTDQEIILKQAIIQAEKAVNDNVLVVSSKGWNHGIVGIVASKLLERYKKPTFVLEEMGDISKGSARSFGSFSAIDAIKNCSDLIVEGGGHELAAGIVLQTVKINDFRKQINGLYESLKLNDQHILLLPKADAMAGFSEITEDFLTKIKQLEPFGVGNPQPTLRSNNLLVNNVRKIGADAQHVKLELSNSFGKTMQFLAFNAPEHFFVEFGSRLNIWYQPEVNEWKGQRLIEGKLLHLEVVE
jgi:single-stranded-DNA-specific exonuclease